MNGQRRSGLPFGDHFQELRVEGDLSEMPWGGDSSLIEGWFAAGEDLEETFEHDPIQWPQEGSLVRAWSWMCSRVLPVDKVHPEVR